MIFKRFDPFPSTNSSFYSLPSPPFRFYEKHDILSWIWCDQQPCDAAKKKHFDYHQQSKHSSATLREFSPGEGYGGEEEEEEE